MSEQFMFRRPALAERIAETALGRDAFETTAGTFLAAPRRTGKSTFLTSELVPVLKAKGALPVYVDLWSNTGIDPAQLLMEAVKAEARLAQGRLRRAIRGTGLSKVGIGSWVSVDVANIGAPGGPTLGAALADLITGVRKPVVLVVDEAQHAITSEAGRVAMFALKSARDTINIPPHQGKGSKPWLGLVFTGSNRDKLASLVSGRAQPFFGSSVTAFPLLGRDYAAAYAAFVNGRPGAATRYGADEMYEAFQAIGHRPQLLHTAVKNHVLGMVGGGDAPDGPVSLNDHARAAREAYWTEFDAQWASLTPLQQAVLERLLEQGGKFRPFDIASVSDYAARTGRPVSPGDAQAGLDALREKGLVVRLERGRYTPDDSALGDWYAARSGRAGTEENDGGDGAGGGAGGGPRA